MSPSEVDWAVLRRPIVVLVISVAVTAALVAGAHYYSSGVTSSHLGESRRLASARTRYLTLDDEKRLIEEFYPQFEELVRQGLVGEEQRLDWIESLRQVAERLKLPSLRYEIGSQREHDPDFPVESGRFAVFASEMVLDIGLLHEEDLPRFLDALAERAAGTFTVTSCRMQPAHPGEFQTDPTKPNLNAQCRLRWFVVKLREDAPDTGRGARRVRRGS